MTILNMVYYSKQDSGWDLSKWAISQTSSALSSTWYGGVHFNNDGTKIYLTQYGNSGKIHEGTLSTPYDLSTISITNSLSVQYPEDIHFSGDGTKMFILKSDSSPYRILRYTLSTAWDLSTATQDQYIDRGSNNADRGLYITPDGKNIYIGTRSGSSEGLVKYTLSTAWDLSTAGTVESISNIIGGISIWFGNNGKLLFTSTEGISTIRYYNLSTAYDLSTITESGTLNIAGATRAGGMWFNDSGTMCVIVGGGGSTNYVTKYTLVGWKPGANTIAYYPLTSASTVIDQSGNNRNLTNSNVSFGTQFGVDCAYISGNADSSHSVTKYLYGNITGLPTGSSARTYSFWVYNNNASVPSAADDMYIFQGQTGTNKMVFVIGGGVDNSSGLMISQRGSSGSFGASIRQQRCHNVITYDGARFEWYVNGVSRGTWTYTINTGSNKFSIFGASENPAWNAFNGGMSELILEDKARTAEEAAAYYNNTKSKYGY